MRPRFARSGRTYRGGGRSRTTSFVAVLVLVWLVIGVFAAGQRDYFGSAPRDCAGAGTIALTIAAGPLNYLGLNPTVGDCHIEVPQPSS